MAEPRPVDYERQQRECERAMVGRVARFEGRDWVVCTVDHLSRVGALRGVVLAIGGGWSGAGDYAISNVPINDLAHLVGCSCRMHGELELPKLPAPAAPAAASTLAWVSCAKQPAPDDQRIFWWRPGPYPRRLGSFSAGRFYNDLENGDDVTGVGAEQVTHWAPMPSNEPALTVDDGTEDSRG